MDHLHPFEVAIATDWPVERWRDLTVLVAVSGGADSTALLRALDRIRKADSAASGCRLVAAHFNHGWRGAESDGDASFVRSLARQLSLPVVIGRWKARSSEGHTSLQKRDEDSARRARYRFLTDVASRFGARYLLTAHTADDQVETILQRVLRGTGLVGLSGIPRVRRLNDATTLLRPMLTVPRDDVVAYLAALGQSFRADGSNSSLDFARNRIRHQLLPLARELYSGVDDAVWQLGELAAEAHAVIDLQVRLLLEQSLVAQSDKHAVLRVPAFKQVAPYLVREALRLLWRQQHWPNQGMGLNEWNALAELVISSAAASNTTRVFPGQVHARRQGELLSLTRPSLSSARC